MKYSKISTRELVGWLVGCGISTVVGYLKPYPIYTYIYMISFFEGISTVMGYLIPNSY